MTQLRIRILVIDANPILLEGISVLIRDTPDMELVGSTSNADVGLELFTQTRPDLTLIDLDFPSAQAIDLIRKIRKKDAQAKTLVLATYELDPVGAAALAAGASAVVAKSQIFDVLIPLIRQSATPR